MVGELERAIGIEATTQLIWFKRYANLCGGTPI